MAETRNRHSRGRNARRTDAEIPYPVAKTCSKCKTLKPRAEFRKARSESDGLKSYCKACGKQQRADYHARHREAQNAKVVAYQKANPEKVKVWARATYYRNHNSRRERAARSYEQNRESITAASRERYATDEAYRLKLLESCRGHAKNNPEAKKAYFKKYRAENRAKMTILGDRHRARKLGAEGQFTHADWLAVLEEFGHRCAYCLAHESEAGRLTVDHLIPLSRGGSNWPDNLAPACKSCNSAKNDRTVLEYVAGLSPTRAFKKACTFA